MEQHIERHHIFQKVLLLVRCPVFLHQPEVCMFYLGTHCAIICSDSVLSVFICLCSRHSFSPSLDPFCSLAGVQSQQAWHQRWLSSLEQLAAACPCVTCQRPAVTQRLLSLVGSLLEPLPVSIALLCGRATCASLLARCALGPPCSLSHGYTCVASFKHLTALLLQYMLHWLGSWYMGAKL